MVGTCERHAAYAISGDFTCSSHLGLMIRRVMNRIGPEVTVVLLKPDDDRMRWLEERCEAGLSMNAMAIEAGVTRETIRLRIMEAGLYRLWSHRHGAVVAEAVLQRQQRRAADKADRRNALIRQPRAQAGKRRQIYTDDQMLNALRDAAASEGEPLSGPTYDDWARSQPERLPAAVTFLLRFGTWRQALAAAGVKFQASARTTYVSRWTDEQLVGWVTDYTREAIAAGKRPSVRAAAAYAEERGGPGQRHLMVRIDVPALFARIIETG